MPSSGRKSFASAKASRLRCAPAWLAAGVPTPAVVAGRASVCVMRRGSVRGSGGRRRGRGPMDEWPSTVGVEAPLVKARAATRRDSRVPTADAVPMTDPLANPPIPDDEALERLAAARAAFNALRPRVIAGE